MTQPVRPFHAKKILNTNFRTACVQCALKNGLLSHGVRPNMPFKKWATLFCLNRHDAARTSISCQMGNTDTQKISLPCPRYFQMAFLSCCMEWRKSMIVRWIFVFHIGYDQLPYFQMAVLSCYMECSQSVIVPWIVIKLKSTSMHVFF